MNYFSMQQIDRVRVSRRLAEHVERKGVGHPDTICDSVMESVSQALCGEYLKIAGRVLHHNVDKGLLVAGVSEPKPGGGTILEPMKLILGGRATTEFEGQAIAVGEIAEAAATSWLQKNLRHVDPTQHAQFQTEIRPGSPELRDIFDRETPTANDTSFGVGFAPLSETEQLVLETEKYLNSPAFQAEFPEAGEDVKVMAFRRERQLALTVALAFVDRFVTDQKSYFARKDEIRDELTYVLQSMLHDLDSVHVDLNTLDDRSRGDTGMYLTVLGTSADGADGGQVGRGNRIDGLINPARPMSLEAAAGKNPVSHVGKIYNAFARQIAESILEHVEPVEEACVYLCSQIGRPLNAPWSTSVELVLHPGVLMPDVAPLVEHAVSAELARLPSLLESLTNGDLAVC